MKLIFVALFSLLSTVLLAQPPAGPMMGQGQPPSIGHIFGKVTDSLAKP